MAPSPHLASPPRSGRTAPTVGSRFPASALVLAGGRSSRFGVDKLEVYVGGQPLLRYALGAAASVCQEALVVATPDDPGPERVSVTAALAAAPGVLVRVVHDDEPFGGPLLGVLAGLRAARYPLCLVVGGDMPLLRPELLARMLAIARADPEGPSRSIALRLDGATQPLPIVLRRDATLAIAALIRAGRRALRDLLETVPFRVLEPEAWLPCDPDATSFVDVDRIEDLLRWSATLSPSASGPS